MATRHLYYLGTLAVACALSCIALATASWLPSTALRPDFLVNPLAYIPLAGVLVTFVLLAVIGLTMRQSLTMFYNVARSRFLAFVAIVLARGDPDEDDAEDIALA